MSLLNTDLQHKLSNLFGKGLANPVTLHFFTQGVSVLSVPSLECDTCQEAGELLTEVTALSNNLKLETHDFVAEADLAKRLGVERIPAIVLEGKNKGTLRYYGVPGGYEFSLLVEDLLDVSKGSTQLGASTLKGLAAINSPVHIQVLVTPT